MRKMFLLSFFVLAVLSLTKISFASIYDDFNDNSLDLNRWIPWTSPAPTIQLQEYGGSLNIDGNSGNRSRYGGEESTFLFGGDFDISMQWKDWTYSGNNGPYEDNNAQVGFQIAPYGKTGTDNISIVRMVSPDGTNQYVSKAKINNSEEQPHSTATSNTAGYFRIARQGSVISTYYSTDNHNWNNLLTANNAFTDPVVIGLKGYTGDYTNSFHAEWDNVDVDSSRPGFNLKAAFQSVLHDFEIAALVDPNNFPESELDPIKPMWESLKIIDSKLNIIPTETQKLIDDIVATKPLISLSREAGFVELAKDTVFSLGMGLKIVGTIALNCPGDLVIIGPDGKVISKDLIENNSAIYWEADFLNQGVPIDLVLLTDPNTSIGDYSIKVVRTETDKPTDKFNLMFVDNIPNSATYGQTLTLVDEQMWGDLNEYTYNLKVNNVTAPVPEPATLSLLGLGLLGLVFRRKKASN